MSCCLVAVCGLLTAEASLVAEQNLVAWASAVAASALSSCGAQVQSSLSMWNLPRPGIEPMSPALAGGLLSTAPPGAVLQAV